MRLGREATPTGVWHLHALSKELKWNLLIVAGREVCWRRRGLCSSMGTGLLIAPIPQAYMHCD